MERREWGNQARSGGLRSEVWNSECEEREMTQITNRVNKISKSVKESRDVPPTNEQEATSVACIAEKLVSSPDYTRWLLGQFRLIHPRGYPDICPIAMR